MSISLPSAYLNKLKELFAFKVHKHTQNDITDLVAGGIQIQSMRWTLYQFSVVGRTDATEYKTGDATVIRFTYGNVRRMMIFGSISESATFYAGAYRYVEYPVAFSEIPVTVIQSGNANPQNKNFVSTQRESEEGFEVHVQETYTAPNFGFIAIGTY